MSKELLGSLELNRVYQMDCLEGMKLIPNRSIDLICCDPPFGTTHANWDKVISFKKMWEQYNRIIKDDGVIILFASQPFTSLLINSNLKMYRYSWIWDKVIPFNFLNAKKQPLRQYEDICVFSKNSPRYFPIMEKRDKPIKGYIASSSELNREIDVDKTERIYDFKFPINILRYKKDKKERYHPTQKPIPLLEYLIKTYTKDEDEQIILDNCMGSGTTAVATLKVGGNRRFLGFETEPKYIEICNARIEAIYDELDDKKLLDNI